MFDMLKKLKKSIKILMLVLVVLVILFVVGIATQAFVLSGICAAGFIICAIAIAIIYSMQEKDTVFKESKYMKNISTLIKGADSIEIKAIAKQYNIRESQARHIVFECFKANLIDGYTMNGDKVEKIELTEDGNNEVKVVKCLGCGARFASNEDIKRCPYCGSLYE
ncbi:MAG: hypothetical protein IJW25_02685 [Clostridia bacterium]|nr:hypothetical protein [Clostridia bacterium]